MIFIQLITIYFNIVSTKGLVIINRYLTFNAQQNQQS